MHGDCSYLDAGRLFHGSVPMVMGTRFDMVIPDISENAARLIWKELCDWLEGADALLNRFDEGSEVARINSGASVQPSADLAEWIATGERYSTLTEGLFSVRPCGKLDFGGLAKQTVKLLMHRMDGKERSGVRLVPGLFIEGSTIGSEKEVRHG